MIEHHQTVGLTSLDLSSFHSSKQVMLYPKMELIIDNNAIICEGLLSLLDNE